MNKLCCIGLLALMSQEMFRVCGFTCRNPEKEEVAVAHHARPDEKKGNERKGK